MLWGHPPYLHGFEVKKFSNRDKINPKIKKWSCYFATRWTVWLTACFHQRKRERRGGRGGGTKLTSWFAVKLKCFLKSQRTQKISGSCFKTCVLRWFGLQKISRACFNVRVQNFVENIYLRTFDIILMPSSHPCIIFPDKKRRELVWYRDLWDFSFKIGDENCGMRLFPQLWWWKSSVGEVFSRVWSNAIWSAENSDLIIGLKIDILHILAKIMM